MIYNTTNNNNNNINNNNGIIAAQKGSKSGGETRIRLYIATAHVLHFNTLRRRPLRRHCTHTPPPAAHEFENRITQTPCRQLYLCVDIIYTQ